jgi:squalene-associated FAD-dependent desaturase
VLLGCCHESISFLARIGSLSQVDFDDRIDFIGRSGETLRLASSPLPAPFHLAPSIACTSFITARQKLELARVMAAMLRRPPADGLTAADYMKSLSCSSELMGRLIGPMLESALNEEVDTASASCARMVLVKSLVESRDGWRLGVPAAPLAEIVEGPASRYLAMRGCAVRASARVEQVESGGGLAKAAVLVGGEKIRFDYCVSAVPPWALPGIGLKACEPPDMGWRSIVGVYLFFDEPPRGPRRACVVGEPFGWVFDKSQDFGLRFGCVNAVASAADRLSTLSRDELVDLASRAASNIVPTGRLPVVKRATVYRAARATFSTSAARPPNKTTMPNLFLAGDWTDTGWPATIESAVRSGRAAARAVVSAVETRG